LRCLKRVRSRAADADGTIRDGGGSPPCRTAAAVGAGSRLTATAKGNPATIRRAAGLVEERFTRRWFGWWKNWGFPQYTSAIP